jgi:hypothetical protein
VESSRTWRCDDGFALAVSLKFVMHILAESVVAHCSWAPSGLHCAAATKPSIRDRRGSSLTSSLQKGRAPSRSCQPFRNCSAGTLQQWQRSAKTQCCSKHRQRGRLPALLHSDRPSAVPKAYQYPAIYRRPERGSGGLEYCGQSCYVCVLDSRAAAEFIGMCDDGLSLIGDSIMKDKYFQIMSSNLFFHYW